MTKLTNSIREKMARRLVQHRFADEANALSEQGTALADRAHAHLYTPDVLAAMDFINAKFPGNFTAMSNMRVVANGYRLELGGTVHNRWVQTMHIDDREYRVIDWSYDSHSLSGDTALVGDVQSYANRKAAFNEACETAYHEAMAVLNTITTAKRLAEAWPEAMPVIEHLLPRECRTLPAVQLDDINAKFGLPPVTEGEDA